ncbi:hypothetical protein GGR73_003293 [Xanthomonas sp. F14]
MHLALNHKDPTLTVVYELSNELRDDPEHVQIVQALSLNNDKPFLGLKPVNGLFGSNEWWESIKSGHIKTVHVTGTIRDLVFAGQDSRWGDSVNSFNLKQDDGTVVLESIYAHEKHDRKLFRVGAKVSCWYALLELKSQPAPDGGVNYARTLLEMAVSA